MQAIRLKSHMSTMGDSAMDASGSAGGGDGADAFSIDDAVAAGADNAAALATPGAVLSTASLPHGNRDLLGTPGAAHSGRGSTAAALESFVAEEMARCDEKDAELAGKLDGMNARLDSMASAIRESSAAQVDVMKQMLVEMRAQRLPANVAPRIAAARAAEAQFEDAIAARRGGTFDDRTDTAAHADAAGGAGGAADAAGGGNTPE